MFQPERAQGVILKKIARRVEEILRTARDREKRGQHLALEIDAKFRLQDMGAVQFQLATAILEEAGGLKQEEVVSELFSLGLAAVLDSAAKAAAAQGETPLLPHTSETTSTAGRTIPIEFPRPLSAVESKTIN